MTGNPARPRLAGCGRAALAGAGGCRGARSRGPDAARCRRSAKLIEQLRRFASRCGGALIDHDGGIEDKAGLLPGLIGQADIVYFPVDCISHRAAEQVKQVCRQFGRPFAPLRSASLASFIAAARDADAPALMREVG